MELFDYVSGAAVPIVILIILLYGFIDRQNVFDLFLKGANEGLKMVIKIFPTIIGLFLAIGALRSSGILDFLVGFISPCLDLINIPKEIMPLAILRPISGSGSIAIATDLMKNYGVDSFIGLITATIMGSTETTLYTIAVYTGSVDIKKTRFVLLAALSADVAGMVASVAFWRFLSKSFC